MTPEEHKRERARERRRARAAKAAQAADAKAADANPVGYASPPKHSQFKPGKSGNPSGRPKGKRSFNEIVEKSVMTPVEISTNGRRRRVPAIEAIILRAVKKALEGDLSSQKMVMSIFQGRGLDGPAAGSEEAQAQQWAEARESLRRKLDALDDDNPAEPGAGAGEKIES